MIIKDITKAMMGPTNVFKYGQVKRKKQKPENARLLAANKDFHNIHDGKRCFILGNGPSIKSVDFSLLEKEYVFTVNQMTRMKNFYKLKTNYHMWGDERFFDIREDREEDMELLDVMRSVNTDGNKPVVFYKSAAYSMVEKYKLSEAINIKYFDDSSFAFPLPTYTFDLTKEIPACRTIIHYAIILAVYMGFKEIYLLGCDCTGIIGIVQSRMETQGEENYAYTVTEAEKKRMHRTNSMNPMKDELRAYAALFDGYEWMDEYCRKHGVKLYNATEPTLLDCIEKVKLEDVLNQGIAIKDI